MPPSSSTSSNSTSSTSTTTRVSYNDMLRRRFYFLVLATIFVLYHVNYSKNMVYNNNNYYKCNGQDQAIQPTTILRSSTTSDTTMTSNSKSSAKNKHNKYPTDDGNIVGILSELSSQNDGDDEFFQTLRDKIDYANNYERCERYGWKYTGPTQEELGPNRLPPILRKIYFGSLIANEPWELFEIVAAETYGIYEGIVFVESNRTQNLTPRNTTRLQHTSTFQKLFNTSNIQVRHYVNEDKRVKDLEREHAQRDDILKGWRDIGMKREDIGILGDADECQTRDFLRALQFCTEIDSLNYSKVSCLGKKMGIRGRGQVYESSPECITDKRSHWRPLIYIGHCIQYIGDTTKHIIPKYNGRNRVTGYGSNLNLTLTNGSIPIMTAKDFRTFVDGDYPEIKQIGYGVNTGYHFHNFFTSIESLRHKYYTYGHPQKSALNVTLEELANDLSVAAYCARNVPDPKGAKWKRVIGGYDVLPPFRPIYFHDPIYRKKRHEYLIQLMKQEDERIALEEKLASYANKDSADS